MLVRAGGVGQHTPTIRAKAAYGLSFLGLHIDDARNQTAADDCDLTFHRSKVRACVIIAREHLEIVRRVLT